MNGKIECGHLEVGKIDPFFWSGFRLRSQLAQWNSVGMNKGGKMCCRLEAGFRVLIGTISIFLCQSKCLAVPAAPYSGSLPEKAAFLLANPPSVDFLIYREEHNGKTTYGRLLYETKNFNVRECKSQASLDASLLTKDSAVYGRLGDELWYVDGNEQGIMRVTDTVTQSSTNTTNAAFASAAIWKVNLFSRRALNILMLDTQATPLDVIAFDNLHFTFTNVVKDSVSSTILTGDNENEVFIDSVISNAGVWLRSERVVCRFATNNKAGFFPFLIEKMRKNSDGSFKTIETVRILDFQPVRKAISMERFSPESAFMVGLPGIVYDTVAKRQYHVFDPKGEARIEIYGRFLRRQTVTRLFFGICVISTAAVMLLILKIKHRTSVKKGST